MPYHDREIFEAMARRLGIHYRYAENADRSQGIFSEKGPPFEPAQEDLAALPPEIVRRIRQSAVELNKQDILAVADEIEMEHPSVTAFIKRHAASYHFDAIERIMERLLTT
jgi:hypothetical protein